MTVRSHGAEAGFTLVEVLVAVGLFALIAASGLALLDTVARAQTGTQGRLERLAALQRADALMTEDVRSLTGPITAAAGEIRFTRLNRDGRGVGISYGSRDGSLVREIGGRRQSLLHPAGPLRIRLYQAGAWRAPGDFDSEAPVDLVELSVLDAENADKAELRRVIRPPAGPPP